MQGALADIDRPIELHPVHHAEAFKLGAVIHDNLGNHEEANGSDNWPADERQGENDPRRAAQPSRPFAALSRIATIFHAGYHPRHCSLLHAEDEATMTAQNDIEARLAELLKIIKEEEQWQVGYPGNQNFDYSPLIPFLSHCLNLDFAQKLDKL